MIWKHRVAIICVCFTVAGGSNLNAEWQHDPSFDVAADKYILAVAQQLDGKTLLGGRFSTLEGESVGFLSRINVDGTIDHSFSPELNDKVSTIAVQMDGKILVGGFFSSTNGESRSHLVRFHPDGSLDNDFQAAPNGPVTRIVPQPDGRILIGGQFTIISGTARPTYARLLENGTLDPGFDAMQAGPLMRPLIALLPDNKIIANTYDPVIGKAIARLHPDGVRDESFNPFILGRFEADALNVQHDGKIIHCQARSANSIQRLQENGTVDATFTPESGLGALNVALRADGSMLVASTASERGQLLKLNSQGAYAGHANHFPDERVFDIMLLADGSFITNQAVFGYPESPGPVRLSRFIQETQEHVLNISPSGQVDWVPAGHLPLFSHAWLDIWLEPEWIPLGQGNPTPEGWRWTDLSLPATGLLRVRGRVVSGYFCGGSGVMAVRLPFVGHELSETYDNWRVLPDLPVDRREPSDVNNASGITNLLAYAMGVHPEDAGSALPRVRLGAGDTSTVKLEFRRNTDSQDVFMQVMASQELAPDSWSPVDVSNLSRLDSGVGWEEVEVEIPKGTTDRQFYRLDTNLTK